MLARVLPSIDWVKNWENEDGGVDPINAIEVPKSDFIYFSGCKCGAINNEPRKVARNVPCLVSDAFASVVSDETVRLSQ